MEQRRQDPHREPALRLLRHEPRAPALRLQQENMARELVLREIHREHPASSRDSFICRSDLNRYREKYVHSLLELEKGELTSLETEVLHSLRSHELLSKNVEAELEQDWTFGERLADRIASFGGSWTFLICFGAFLGLWIAMNTVVQWERLAEIQEIQLELLSELARRG